MFTVIMQSEEYGEERFLYHTLRQALMAAWSLRRRARKQNDGVERTVSLLLDDESLVALTPPPRFAKKKAGAK